MAGLKKKKLEVFQEAFHNNYNLFLSQDVYLLCCWLWSTLNVDLLCLIQSVLYLPSHILKPQ